MTKKNYISGVTVMLSLTVFMNIVSELMPITSDAVPLIGKYIHSVYMYSLDALQYLRICSCAVVQ